MIIRCLGCDRELEAQEYTRNGIPELLVEQCDYCSRKATQKWLEEQQCKLDGILYEMRKKDGKGW